MTQIFQNPSALQKFYSFSSSSFDRPKEEIPIEREWDVGEREREQLWGKSPDHCRWLWETWPSMVVRRKEAENSLGPDNFHPGSTQLDFEKSMKFFLRNPRSIIHFDSSSQLTYLGMFRFKKSSPETPNFRVTRQPSSTGIMIGPSTFLLIFFFFFKFWFDFKLKLEPQCSLKL